ncbi:MAG: Transglutaminase-like domain, partial [uncultured Microvirga sp.]
EDSRRIRDRLRLPPAGSDAADPAGPPLAPIRSRRARTHHLRPAGARHRVPRRVRQSLHPDHSAGGPHHDRQWLRGARPGRAGPRRAAGGAARHRGSPGPRARVSARQPLLRHRPAPRTGLVVVRRQPSGLGQGASGLRLRPRTDRVRLSPCEFDPHRVGRPSRGPRRVSRLRASRDHVLPLPEHPGPLLHGLSGRHRRAARPRADGFFRLVRGVSFGAVVHLRRPAQPSAHRAHPHGAGPGRHRRGDLDQFRPFDACGLQGRHARGRM